MKAQWSKGGANKYGKASVAKVGPFILDVGFNGKKWSFLVHVKSKHEENLMHDDMRVFATEAKCREAAKGWLHDVCHEAVVNLESGYEKPKGGD